MALRTKILALLLSNKVQRPLLSILRKFKPVVTIKGRTLVTRHADVIEVLTRHRDFTITEINAPKLDALHLHFILGMDASEEHTREFHLLQSVSRKNDLEVVRQLVREKSAECLQKIKTAKRFELIHDFNLPVVNSLLDKYFGVLDPGQDPAAVDAWMRILFHQAFLNLINDKKIEQAGIKASRELEAYLLRIIAQKRKMLTSGGILDDTLLNRLIRTAAEPGKEWITDDVIRRQISGLMIGAVDTTSKCVVHVLDELLRRPKHFRRAVAAAKTNDLEVVKGYCWEALRFNPHNSFIVRYCRADTYIGEGRYPNPVLIQKGRPVFASIFSAMFDENVFTDPRKFIPGRPQEYLHFGYGFHNCFGRYLNAVTIPEMTAAVLRLPKLRRAAGKRGRVKYKGPFPDTFYLKFDSVPEVQRGNG
jgi:cytochrome P450